MNVGLPVRMLLYFYLITACFLVLPRMCETTEHILSLSGSWPGSDQTAWCGGSHELLRAITAFAVDWSRWEGGGSVQGFVGKQFRGPEGADSQLGPSAQ